MCSLRRTRFHQLTAISLGWQSTEAQGGHSIRGLSSLIGLSPIKALKICWLRSGLTSFLGDARTFLCLLCRTWGLGASLSASLLPALGCLNVGDNVQQ